MEEDIIIKEIREIAKRLSEKCDNDPEKFGEMLKISSEKYRKEGWKIVTKEDLRKMREVG